MVNDEQELLTVDVGGRLRELRMERGKSMRAVARDSGLSTNALSMIERGRTSPSVSTLNKIAAALDIPITAFFRIQPEKQDIVFVKAKGRRRINFENVVWEGLGGESFTGYVEPFIVTMEEDASSGPFGMIHNGHEFVMCLQGQIEYEVENQRFILESGDSLIFSAQLRHRWHNTGNEPASVIIVLAGFDKGERPSEYHISSIKKS